MELEEFLCVGKFLVTKGKKFKKESFILTEGCEHKKIIDKIPKVFLPKNPCVVNVEPIRCPDCKLFLVKAQVQRKE